MSAPEFRKNRKRIWNNTSGEIEKFDPYEMNPTIYKMILDFIEIRGLTTEQGKKHYVNKLMPNKPNLYDTFLAYRRIYLQIVRSEKKQQLVDKLNEEIDNMEDHKNFGLSLVKKRVKGDKKKDHIYKKEFDFFDKNIELIQNMIYMGVSPVRICEHFYPKMKSITPIIFAYWKDETKHIEKLIFAYKSSGEQHMYLSKDFMMDWLDKEKHPELDMQHVGIVREIALWHSRMAGFLDRKKWGAKVEVTDERAQVKVISGKDLNSFLEGLGKVAEKINSESEESEEGEESAEDIDFTDFEEAE